MCFSRTRNTEPRLTFSNATVIVTAMETPMIATRREISTMMPRKRPKQPMMVLWSMFLLHEFSEVSFQNPDTSFLFRKDSRLFLKLIHRHDTV